MFLDNAEGRDRPDQAQEYLGGASYPLRKDDLVNHARQRGAPREIVNFLERISDKEYSSLVEVAWEMGRLVEGDGENKEGL
jgi:hypothetical protein